MAQLMFAIIVILALPKRNKELITYIKTIILKMTGNANFASPTPPLADVGKALTAFEDAETAMGIHKAVKGDRAKKKRELVDLLKHLRDYIQGICEANVDSAAAIAESAGLRLRKYTTPVKALFAVVQGPVSGTVLCAVRATRTQTTYYWSYSVDQKNWLSAPDSLTSKVTISGLTPGQTYAFRYRTLTRKGLSDFSQTVTCPVT